MIRPNLFIIGAPKCGTSSLFDWLLMHPEIAGTKTKEPFFLIDPAHPLAKEHNASTEGLEGYKDLFTPQARDASIRVEATTHYLFDPIARSIIKDMPDARVLIVLREPAARVYSSFRYTANNLARLDPSLTFRRYLRVVEQGKSLMPEWCSHAGSAHVLQNDLFYSRYHFHVAPWVSVLGWDRLRVLLMEDMVKNPQDIVAEVISWLGLDPDLLPKIPAAGRNRTEQVRCPRLHGVMRSVNARLRPPEAIRTLLKRGYGKAQFRSIAEISSEDCRAIDHLRASYVEDNARLAAITDLDLSAWHNVKLNSASTP